MAEIRQVPTDVQEAAAGINPVTVRIDYHDPVSLRRFLTPSERIAAGRIPTTNSVRIPRGIELVDPQKAGAGSSSATAEVQIGPDSFHNNPTLGPVEIFNADQISS